jgi:hypothetical protein
VEARELVRVQAYMRKIFGAKTLSVRARPKVKDSAEVYVGEEFVGTVTRDEDEGELCYGHPRGRPWGRVRLGAERWHSTS